MRGDHRGEPPVLQLPPADAREVRLRRACRGHPREGAAVAQGRAGAPLVGRRGSRCRACSRRDLPGARLPGGRPLPRGAERGLARADVHAGVAPADARRGKGAGGANPCAPRALLPGGPNRCAGRRRRRLVGELRGPPGPMSLWRHRDFRRLWAGQTVSVFGSQVTELALPLVAVLTLHATAFQMGLLAAVGMAPWIAFALLVGVWVDRRVRRRWILVSADLGRAAILLSVPVAAAFHVLSLGQLFVVAFAAGCLTLAFNIAWGSYLNVLVPREQLVEGNSKLMGSYATAQIGGPSLAGVLVQAVTAPFAI